jgi:putative oxidoreductase
MALLQFIIPIIAGGLLNILLKPHLGFACKMAGILFYLALVLSAGSWAYGHTCTWPVLICKSLSFILNWDAATCNLLLGYLFVFTFSNLNTGENDADEHLARKLRNAILLGITMLVGNPFLMASIGMAENPASMLAFFKASGYASWFLYFIMVVEAFGALGVLLHFKLKTGPIAAAGLMLIMIGALYTHRHNNDAFAASYAAIGQLVMLSLLQITYYLEKQEAVVAEYYNMKLTGKTD